MNIEMKPVLAGVIGILILLIPETIQTADRLLPLLLTKGLDKESNIKDMRFPIDSYNTRGLYGYRYRGF